MALDTYTGLKASVADFLNRADLTAVIPDFITLAEAQMHRRFVGRQKQGMPIPRRMISRADIAILAADEYLTLPTDYAATVDFFLNGSPIVELDYLDVTNLNQWKASTTTSGKPPRYYSVVGTQYQIYPVADQAYTGKQTYISRVPALSGSNATNWVLTDYPDAYLYGALVQAAPYLKDDGRLTTWGTLFTAAIDDICNSDPVPSDKQTLRTEFPQLTRFGRYGYDITRDTF